MDEQQTQPAEEPYTWKQRFKDNWINIVSLIIFLMVCGWLIFHDPCEMCKVNKEISCKDIVKTYVEYADNMSRQQASVMTMDLYTKQDYLHFNLSAYLNQTE